MKDIRISFRGFEKSMNSFIDRRVIGSKPFNGKTKHDFPLTMKKVTNKIGEEIYYSELMDNDTIRVFAKKLINSYKSKPFSKKSGFKISSLKPFVISGNSLLNKENPVQNFFMSWNFEDDFLYFKFFVRFTNGKKNRRVKQMKIQFKNSNPNE